MTGFDKKERHLRLVTKAPEAERPAIKEVAEHANLALESLKYPDIGRDLRQEIAEVAQDIIYTNPKEPIKELISRQDAGQVKRGLVDYIAKELERRKAIPLESATSKEAKPEPKVDKPLLRLFKRLTGETSAA